MNPTRIYVAITLTCIVLLIYTANKFANYTAAVIETESKRYSKHLGTTIITESDTLMIVNYSIWRENFTLSNGKTIQSDLIMKHD